MDTSDNKSWTERAKEAHAVYSPDSPDYILWLERRLRGAEGALREAAENRKEAMARVYECREEVVELEYEINKWKKERYGKNKRDGSAYAPGNEQQDRERDTVEGMDPRAVGGSGEKE